jgi:hypothetical protein
MVELNIRCCCNPRKILGTVDITFEPTGDVTVLVDGQTRRIRQYYESRPEDLHMEWAIQAHDRGHA